MSNPAHNQLPGTISAAAPPPVNHATGRADHTALVLPAVAWIVILLISALPAVISNEVLHIQTAWLFWAQIGLLIAGLLLGWRLRAVFPLRPFFALFLVLMLAERGIDMLAARLPLQRMMAISVGDFVNALARQQAQRLAVALVMLAASWVLMRRRAAFFFTPGQLNAPAAPMPWVGMQRPSTWNRLGPLMALCLAGGLTLFITLAGGAPLSNLSRAWPVLPLVVLFAAANAFGEEMNYRAPQLGALAPVVGGRQALLMMATYFGLGHFYGVPYGVVGVVMAGVLGWLLGRSLLETRGFFWAWFIHFVMDGVIFGFMVVGSVTPGGR